MSRSTTETRGSRGTGARAGDLARLLRLGERHHLAIDDGDDPIDQLGAAAGPGGGRRERARVL